MIHLNPSGALFRRVERLLTAIAACVAGGITVLICRALAPELNDPIALIASAVAAVAIFFNVFGAAILLLLLPWEALAGLSRHAH